MGLFKKSDSELERDFLRKAEQSARMPSIHNRKAAQKAYDQLPKFSIYRDMKFEGWSGK